MNFSDAIMNAKNLAKAYYGDKKEYELQFNHEDDNRWYIDFPNWGFSHHNLMMVSGADDLCAYLSDDDKFAYVKVIPAKKEEDHPGYAKLVQKSHSLFGGSTYQVIGFEGFDRDIWLCPVTLFVLGEYPKYIYLKKSDKPKESGGISRSDTDKSDNASKPDAVKSDTAKSAGDMSKEEMLKQKVGFAESYYEQRVTPDHITSLQPDEVFVFGSNAQGHHGGGAAAFAMRNFGAVWGQGEGMQGQCYAIPTMEGMENLEAAVWRFIDYADSHPRKRFLVTAIGCGIAGYLAREIAPLFKGCIKLENVSLPASFWKELGLDMSIF